MSSSPEEPHEAKARDARFCSYCGAALTHAAPFCASCGEPVAAAVYTPRTAAASTGIAAQTHGHKGARLAILGVVLVLAGAGAVAASGAPSAKHTLTGTMSVFAADNSQTLEWLGHMVTSTGEVQLGGACSTAGAYSDITPGTDVTVRDDTDKVVGSAFLAAGTLAMTTAKPVCVFEFTVTGIPDAKSYAIEIGQRRGVTYSAADLEANEWSLALTAN